MRNTHSQARPKRRTLDPLGCLYRAVGLFSVALLTSFVGIGATPAAAATCASLAGLTLPDTTITAAEPIAAGTYTAPDGEVFANLPAFCRIAATLTPTSDSNIKIEVWMPYSGGPQPKPAALGGLRVLHHAERQILQHRTLRATGNRRSELVARDQRAGPTTTQLHPG